MFKLAVLSVCILVYGVSVYAIMAMPYSTFSPQINLEVFFSLNMEKQYLVNNFTGNSI